MVNYPLSSGEDTRTVYKRFQAPTPLPDGSRPNYIITNLEPERWDEGVNIMMDLFLQDEPLSYYGGINSCPDSLATTRKSWSDVASKNAALVCYREDDTKTNEGGKLEIAGINMTYVQKNGVERFDGSGAVFEKISKTLEIIGNELDVYKKFNVESYLSALGLCTLKKYRRQGIGKELLLARIPLCKSLGLKVSITTFTAFASQQLAEKCGFKLLVEKSYADFEKDHGLSYPGITTKSLKLMALEID